MLKRQENQKFPWRNYIDIRVGLHESNANADDVGTLGLENS